MKISRETLVKLSQLKDSESMTGYTSDGTHFLATGDKNYVAINWSKDG